MLKYVGGSSPRIVPFLKRKKIDSLEISTRTKKLLTKTGRFSGKPLDCHNLYDLYLLVRRIREENPFNTTQPEGLDILCAITGFGTVRITKLKRAIRKTGLNLALFNAKT